LTKREGGGIEKREKRENLREENAALEERKKGGVLTKNEGGSAETCKHKKEKEARLNWGRPLKRHLIQGRGGGRKGLWLRRVPAGGIKKSIPLGKPSLQKRGG